MSPEVPKSTPEKSTPELNNKENSMSSRIESLTIKEDVKEGEAGDEEGLPIYPYERLKTNSTNPVTEIDVTKREVNCKQLAIHYIKQTFMELFLGICVYCLQTYLSSAEFKEKFGMAKDAFYKMPKWKQNKLKMALQLF